VPVLGTVRAAEIREARRVTLGGSSMHSSNGGQPAEPARHSQAVPDDTKKTKSCYKVLFICRDNSAYSIIAEAILKRWGGKDFRAFSAGIRPAREVHPLAIDLLKTQRLWEQDFQTKACDEFLRHDAESMNFVISIGEQPFKDLAAEWPGNPRVFHWRISDPTADGKPAERALAFRRTFRELENRIKLFILVHEREKLKKVAA
jgi:arsenate reductase